MPLISSRSAEPRSEDEGSPPGFRVAAAGLLLYGLGLLWVALSLPHVGLWTIGAGALLLLSHAAGLWMRRRVAWTFGIAFYGLTGLACAILAPLILYWGYRAFADQTLGEGFGALGAGIAVGMAMACTPIIFLLGVVSGFVARSLLRGRDSLEGAGSRGALSVAVLGTLASFGLLAWNGFEYFPRDLPARNACAGGSKDTCFALSHSDRPFSAAERREFMRHGCRHGSDMTCVSLMRGDALQRTPGAGPAKQDAPAITKAELDVVTTACRSGRLDACKALAEHLLAAGDVDAATGHLSFACSRSARFCSDAAELLRKRGQPALAGTFHGTGCDGGHAEGCRALLAGKNLPDQERRRLERRSCLQGVNDICDDMIARDFPGACEHVCSMDEARAAYVCSTCARKAAILGDAAQARAWMDLSCAHGLKAACREAAGPDGAVSAPAPEQPSPATAPAAGAMRTRLAELMPQGCRVIDARDDNGMATITGLADSTACVSEALRALDALGARPVLLEIQAQGGKHRFRASLSAAALEDR